MASYLYMAREAETGREIYGSVDAATQPDAIAALRDRKELVVSIEEKVPKQSRANGGRVDELRRETLDGRSVYEGEILKGGKVTLLQVDLSGQIVHRGPTHDAPTSHRPFAALGK